MPLNSGVRALPMLVVPVKPLLEVWIPGQPQSAQKKGSKANYVERIRTAAKAMIGAPLRSPRIDVEIWFSAPGFSRPDVDNVIKPVLDAFVGVVYEDDNQVRSVRAVAIPSDDATTFPERANVQNVVRVLKGEEFLVAVYEGRRLARSAI
jgi:hypothetical protein